MRERWLGVLWTGPPSAVNQTCRVSAAEGSNLKKVFPFLWVIKKRGLWAFISLKDIRGNLWSRSRTKPWNPVVCVCLCPPLSSCLRLFVVGAAEAEERRVHAGQQSYWSITPPSLSPSVQALVCFWQLLLTIMDVTANFCENWHIWQLKCHMPYRIFFGRFPHLYNRWIRYKSGSLLIHSFPLFFPSCFQLPGVFPCPSF